MESSLYHTLLLSENGELFAWGKNPHGQIGNGTSNTSKTLYNLTADTNNPLYMKKIVYIAASYHNSYAVDNEGNLYTWGDNRQYQIGDGSTQARLSPYQIPRSYFDNESVIQVAGSTSAVIALTENGRVFTWGSNNNSVLGNGHGGAGAPLTALVKYPESISEKIYLSNQSDTKVDSPLLGIKIKKIVASGYNVLVQAENNDMYIWGSNDRKQIDNTATAKTKPQLFLNGFLTTDEHVIDFDGGTNHFVALTNKGGIITWGYNGYGQLGIGNTNNSLTQFIQNKTTNNIYGKNIVKVYASTNQTLFIDDQGSYHGVGSNTKKVISKNIVENSKITNTIFIQSYPGIIGLTVGDGWLTLITSNEEIHTKGSASHTLDGTTTTSEDFIKIDYYY